MNIEPRYTELMNADIDGDISADDKALLERYLEEHPEARAYRDQLRAMCRVLDDEPTLDAPKGLGEPALARIRPASARTRASGPSLAETINNWFSIPAVKYAMSFAAGVILTFALVTSDQASRSAFDDVTSLVGTMSSIDARGGAAARDDLQLSLNELAGSVSLLSAGQLMILDFDLASTQPVEIVARFDNRDIWFNGFAQLQSTGTTVAAATGQVTVRMDGQRRYAVYLHNSGGTDATVSLDFYSSGALLHEGELTFQKLD